MNSLRNWLTSAKTCSYEAKFAEPLPLHKPAADAKMDSITCYKDQVVAGVVVEGAPPFGVIAVIARLLGALMRRRIVVRHDYVVFTNWRRGKNVTWCDD